MVMRMLKELTDNYRELSENYNSMKKETETINKHQEENNDKISEVKKYQTGENQDGGLGRHTEPPLTTRTHRKSKGKEVRHQVHKKETYIQTPVGEDSRCRGGTETGRVWDEQGRQSDH